MQRLIAVVTAFSFLSVTNIGCYNTYVVEKAEFSKLQRLPDGESNVVVQDARGRGVVVGDSTGLFVRSEGGRRYPVTAFNFKITNTQLVASDRDNLLALSNIASFEIDHLSTWKTIGMVSAGVAGAVGVIVGIILTAGTKSFGGGE